MTQKNNNKSRSALTMLAQRLKRDFTTSTVSIAVLFALCLLQYVETSANTGLLFENDENEKRPHTNNHMNLRDYEQQQQQTLLAYARKLSGLSYESINRILRDEKVSVNQMQDDEANWQIYQMPHVIERRSTTPNATSYLQLSARNLSTFNAFTDFQGDHMHIKELNLSWNALLSVNLTSLHQLQWVDLSHNKLSALPSDLFVGNETHISVLNLNYNRIHCGATAYNFYLRELYLSGNEIEHLTALNLTLLRVLETLDLSCNRIANIDGVIFPHIMSNLQYLNMANNQLSVIYRENFYNLLNLNFMVLSNNNISDIDYETFLAIPNLQFLDLSHNRLKGSSIRALQGIPELIYLSISENIEVGASMQEFVASWSLKQLDASGTNLCKIPAVLAQSVRMLKLTDNWLKLINCGDLDSYPLLQYLDISYTHLESIEDDALGRLEVLEILFLDHNQLTRIPYSLPTSLVHLFLHDNQITDVQIQTFQNLNNLRTLDLSGNQLVYLPALQLPKLLTLNLQSSGLRGFSQAMVHSMPRLRDLLLENNPIKCSELLSIAEWASPCRSMEHSAEYGSNNHFAHRTQDEVGQFPQPMLSVRIDLKQKFERLNKFFQKFHSTCSSQALRRLEQRPIKQPTCTTDAYNTDKLPKKNKTFKTKKKNKINENYQMDIHTTPSLDDASTFVKTASSSLLVEKSRLLLDKEENISTFTTTVKSETSKITARNAFINSKTTTAAAAAAVLTTLIIPTRPTSLESELPMNNSKDLTTLVGLTETLQSNKRTIAVKHRSDNLQNVSQNTMTVREFQNSSKYLELINGMTKKQKVDGFRLPKNSKRSKHTADLEDIKLPSENTAINTPLTSTSTSMDEDIPLAKQHNSNSSKSKSYNNNTNNASLGHHNGMPMQLNVKDRHFIGTPLLTHNTKNLLAETDKHQKIPQKMSGATEIGMKLENGQMSAINGISHKTILKQNKWLRDITGLSEPDETTAKTMNSNANNDETHFKDLYKANQKIIASTKLDVAAKLLDTIHGENDILNQAEQSEEVTTLVPDLDLQAVTPFHKHSTVNMPVHYLKPHQIHTFSEIQTKTFEQNYVKDTKPDHWIDMRNPHTLDHPKLLMLLSALLLVCLLLGLLHVYRCRIPWKCQSRLHQQLIDDDHQSTFLKFQPHKGIKDATSRPAVHNSPLHTLEVCQLKPSAADTVNRSLPTSSVPKHGSTSSSISQSSHTYSGFEDDEAFYIEITPNTETQSRGELLPMELLTKSSVDKEGSTFNSTIHLNRNQPTDRTTTMAADMDKSRMDDPLIRSTKRPLTRKFEFW